MKYILSFIIGLLFSSSLLLLNTFYNFTNIFDSIITRYYQILYPENLVQNNKTYSVSFGFVPIINEEKNILPRENIPKLPELKNDIDSNITNIDNNKTTIQSPKLVISFGYQHNYDGFSKKEVEEVFKKVENSWAECGVILKYKGESNPSNPYYTGKSIYNEEGSSSNNLYWVDEKGIYGQADVQSSKELGSDSKPFINEFSIKLDNAIDSKNRLEATVVHEFGHVIGLNHSSDPKSVMYFQGEAKQNKIPNKFDIQECKNVLNQIDLAKSNQMLN